MGLDMYLMRRSYVGAQYEHRKAEVKIEVRINGRPLAIDPRKVSQIEEAVGYWRKANAIHAWFVREVQGGIDECQETEVTIEKLRELRDLCHRVHETRDATPLPPQPGFFFGSTEVDDWYFDDLRKTIAIIEALPDDGDYFYRSSW